jgi:hypothetical protein
VAKEDAAHVCALQIQADHGGALAEDDEAIIACIEKYITKQVCACVLGGQDVQCNGSGQVGWVEDRRGTQVHIWQRMVMDGLQMD